MSERKGNLLLITLDSCRFDTSQAAATPELDRDLGGWVPAQAHGTWTWPAHWSLFASWYPDAIGHAPGLDRYQNRLLPRPQWSDGYGTAIESLRSDGYTVAGTGACAPFGSPVWAEVFPTWSFAPDARLDTQIEWLNSIGNTLRPPWLVFVNVAETHYPYGQSWEMLRRLEALRAPRYRQPALRAGTVHSINGPGYPPTGECAEADELYATFRQLQRAALEQVDRLWPALKGALPAGTATALICGDHGECFGEDGLFGHGFSHPCVWEVPLAMAMIQTGQP